MTGRWDERQITGLIDKHYFAFVVTRGQENLYTPAVARAIATAYPRTEEYAGHTIRLAADGPCAADATCHEFAK